MAPQRQAALLLLQQHSQVPAITSAQMLNCRHISIFDPCPPRNRLAVQCTLEAKRFQALYPVAAVALTLASQGLLRVPSASRNTRCNAEIMQHIPPVDKYSTCPCRPTRVLWLEV
jgi:hypothetical protein